MKEKVKQLNIENTQTQLIIKKGENIYNSLRNSDIVLYLDEFKGKLGLQDKKCLSLLNTTSNFSGVISYILFICSIL